MQLLSDLQKDLQNRLLSCPDFANVPVYVMVGNGSKTLKPLRDEVDEVLAGGATPTDKSGLAVLILMPRVRIEAGMRTVPGPQIQVACSIQVVENKEWNMGERGVGITSESLAITILSLCHLFQPRSGSIFLADDSGDAIEPAQPDEDMPVDVVWQVNLATPMSTAAAAKVEPAPTPAYAAGNLTLSGLIGAEHWFTLDGSYPRPGQPNAHLYTAPVAVPADTLVRCASYLPDFCGSDIVELVTA